MTTEIQYRKAQPSDARKLSVLYQQVYIQTYGKEGVSDEFANHIVKQFAVARLENVITTSPDNIIVASYKDNLVGVAELAFNKAAPAGFVNAPELNKLYILEWFCGKGIGNGLLRAAEDTVVQQGHRQMWLWVLDSNHRAIRFYEKQQYRHIGEAAFQMEVNSYNNKVMVKDLVTNYTS